MATGQKSDLIALHVRGEPLILGNAWEVASARALEAEGLKAVATSSGAIAVAQAFRDGHYMPPENLHTSPPGNGQSPCLRCEGLISAVLHSTQSRLLRHI